MGNLQRAKEFMKRTRQMGISGPERIAEFLWIAAGRPKRRCGTVVANTSEGVEVKDQFGRVTYFMRGSTHFPGELAVGTQGVIEYITAPSYGLDFFTPIVARCHDPRHATPCIHYRNTPCVACKEECDKKYLETFPVPINLSSL
jgi:hypothetical protein